MKYAFFDVDNTIYHGYSGDEILFFVNDKFHKAEQIVASYLKVLTAYRAKKATYLQLTQKSLNSVSEAVKGLTFNQISELVSEMLSLKNPLLNEWAPSVFKYLKLNNFKIILVSAGPEFVIKNIAEKIKADEYFATKIPYKNKKFTGEPVTMLNFKLKTQVISVHLKNSQFSIGFGDSVGDIPILELVDLAFVFESHHYPGMKKFAKEIKWHTFTKSSQILKILKKIS